MISQDFYGKKPFIWWAGVVENRMDPLMLGSVQVRIIGLHPIEESEKASVPTEKLPWAQVLLPTTGAKTTSGPKEGDWVFGFFQDGEYAQIPVVMGVFPGIESQQSQIIYKEAVVRKIQTTQPANVSSNINVINVLSDNNSTVVSDVVPTLPPGQSATVVGQPTTPPLSRGIVDGTGIDMVNKFLDHSCDLSFLIKNDIAEIKSKILAEIVASRLQAEGALTASASSPLAQQVKEVIATLKTYWSMIKDYIAIINGVLKMAQDLLDFTIKVIKWALTLPGKLMELVKRCVSSVLSPIGEAVDDVFSELAKGVDVSVATGFGAAFLTQINSVVSQSKSSAISGLSSSSNLSNNPTLSSTISISTTTRITSDTFDQAIDNISDSLAVNEEEVDKVIGTSFDIASYGNV